MWLVVVMFDRNGLGFGLGDDLFRPTLKISAGSCCDNLKCGGCVVGWGSVEGVIDVFLSRWGCVDGSGFGALDGDSC